METPTMRRFRRFLAPIADRLRLAPIALVALPFTACAQSNGGGTTGQASVCDSDPRAETYAVGLSALAMDGAVKASFVDAMPTPPTKGLNTWTIQLSDAQGQPVSGAIMTVHPFMPDHGHGSSVTPQVMPMPTAGNYQVSLLDFFMPGIWDVTFTITLASGPTETLKFTFCVDG
jgi:hypothetical protein